METKFCKAHNHFQYKVHIDMEAEDVLLCLHLDFQFYVDDSKCNLGGFGVTVESIHLSSCGTGGLGIPKSNRVKALNTRKD